MHLPSTSNQILGRLILLAPTKAMLKVSLGIVVVYDVLFLPLSNT